jgi:hypothetical protein
LENKHKKMEALMSKNLFLVIVFLLSVLFVYSNEKPSAISTENVSFVGTFANSSDNIQPSIEKFSKKTRTSTMNNPEQLISLGKTLTATAIGSIIAGSILLGLGAAFTYFSYKEAGVSYTTDNSSYKYFWWNTLMGNYNNSSTWFAGAAILCFATGGILLALAILLIPGIVCWAVGAGARTKSESEDVSSMKYRPFVDNGIGLSIKL